MPRKIHGHETDYVKLQKNYCFACGQNNPDGMRLKFTLDEERQTFVCRFKLGKRYTGPPGHCGIVAQPNDRHPTAALIDPRSLAHTHWPKRCKMAGTWT